MKILKSRTVWMFIGLAVVNLVPTIQDQLPAGWLPVINVVLPILGIYFRTKPKQSFDMKEVGEVVGDLLNSKKCTSGAVK